MKPARAAWAVATHVPHFGHTVDLLRSLATHQVDVDPVVVFSSESDYRRFRDLTAMEFSFLVATDYVQPEELERAVTNRSIINVKKIIALWELSRHYDYVFTPDTECTVLRRGDPLATFDLRRTRRVWPAQAVEDPLLLGIVRSCLDLFDVRDRRFLHEATAGGSLYGWFEDLPGYHRSDVEGFFDYFGARDDVTMLLPALRWETFDHVLYQMYCCLRRGWRYQDSGLPPAVTARAAWELSSTEMTLMDRDAMRTFRQAWPSSWARTSDSGAGSVFVTFHDDR